jgi:hypothetical protein
MSFFCLLWVPLFYLFRRSFSSEGGAGGVWALLLGSVTAIFQFFLGNFISPGGFGFSRWLSGFVDIVSLPVLIPFLVYLALLALRVFSGTADFTSFALLWSIPAAALRALNWSSLGDPVLLVLVPLLWTALAVGLPFLVSIIIRHLRWPVLVFCGLCALALPVLCATAYWAFFSQQRFLGIPLLAAALLPMLIALVLDCVHSG